MCLWEITRVFGKNNLVPTGFGFRLGIGLGFGFGFGFGLGLGSARRAAAARRPPPAAAGLQLWRTMRWRRPRELWRRSAAQCSITLIGNQESYTDSEPGKWLLPCCPSAVVPVGCVPTLIEHQIQPILTCVWAPNALKACASPRLCCRQSRLCVRRTFPTPRANRTGLHFRSSLCDRRRRPR